MIETSFPKPAGRPARELTLLSLSEGRRRLVRLAQAIHFGRLHDLQVRGGEPAFDPPPRIVRTIKTTGANTPRAQARAADFVLKAEWLELFAQLDDLSDGVILRLEVAHGLPHLLEVEGQVL